MAFAVNPRERRSEECDCVFTCTKNPKVFVTLLRYETFKSFTDSSVFKIPFKTVVQNYHKKLLAEA